MRTRTGKVKPPVNPRKQCKIYFTLSGVRIMGRAHFAASLSRVSSSCFSGIAHESISGDQTPWKRSAHSLDPWVKWKRFWPTPDISAKRMWRTARKQADTGKASAPQPATQRTLQEGSGTCGRCHPATSNAASFEHQRGQSALRKTEIHG